MKRDLSLVDERRLQASSAREVPVARSADLPGRRSFLTTNAGGVRLLLTRDRNGVVHAFRNMCLHRDRPLVDGSGRARKLTCGKHGWRYDLEGNLIGNETNNGRKKLAALLVTERDGRIWVILDR